MGMVSDWASGGGTARTLIDTTRGNHARSPLWVKPGRVGPLEERQLTDVNRNCVR